MNSMQGGIPITTRRIVLHENIVMTEGSVALLAFALSEYYVTPHRQLSEVVPVRTTEKILSVSGNFVREGQMTELTLNRKLARDEISRAVARINLLNQFISDIGVRFELGVETLIPLFEGFQAGFRKIDLHTVATVFIFEQDGARSELVSGTAREMTDLRDAFGNILPL